MRVFRKNRRKVALLLTTAFLIQIAWPSSAWAITGGPSSPEASSFAPVGANDMVNTFTGDFSYNLPVMELPGPSGGYPVNLFYNAGITNEQEASWVGLGWNLNVGAISRNVRGIPDDWDGTQKLKQYQDMPSYVQATITATKGWSLFGSDSRRGSGGLNSSFGIYMNNKSGVGVALTVGSSVSFDIVNANDKRKGSVDISASIGFSMDSQQGGSFNSGFNASYEHALKNSEKDRTNKFGLGFSYSQRSGIAFSSKFSRVFKKADAGVEHPPGGGYGGQAEFLNFSQNVPIPHGSFPRSSQNGSFDFSYGYGATPYTYWGGVISISLEDEAYNESDFPAYGYYYMHNKPDIRDKVSIVEDVSRNQDAPLHPKVKNLYSPSYSFDTYSVSGQGISGVFRPYRAIIGHTNQSYQLSLGAGGQGGFQIGAPGKEPPNYQNYGGDLGATHSEDTQGDWVNGNSLWQGTDYSSSSSKLVFRGPNQSFDDDRGVYFRFSNDFAPEPLDTYDEVFNEYPMRIVHDNNNIPLTNNLMVGGRSKRQGKVPVLETISDDLALKKHPSKQKRPIQMFTNAELNDIRDNGSTSAKEILYYFKANYFEVGDVENLWGNNTTEISNYGEETGGHVKESRDLRFDGGVKENHFGGFSILNEEGVRYNYGIPAYNHKQIEESFSIDPSKPHNGVNYNYDTETSPFLRPNYKAMGGSQPSYNRTETGEFAHSYLLTSICGPDYVDSNNDGQVSDEDYGYWVKFNYVKTSDAYKYRHPYLGAQFIEGLHDNPDDDQGFLSSGEKENWYLATAETKTHILIFCISKRQDGRGLVNEVHDDRYKKTNSNETDLFFTNPQPYENDSYSYKLDRIELHEKSEYYKQIKNQNIPVPIKTAHFKYTYELCNDVPNNDGQSGNEITEPSIGANGNDNHGKLTLRKVYFTYRGDLSGKLTPYVFYYSNNQPYDKNGINEDGWGLFNKTPWLPGNSIASGRFKYTPQFDKYNKQSDAVKAAFHQDRVSDSYKWCLDKISLPGGSEISIKYEPDEYGHVQHKKATQMFPIAGAYNPPGSGKEDELYDGNWDDSEESHYRIYFPLEYPVPVYQGPNQSQHYSQLANDLFEKYIEPLRAPDGRYYTRIKALTYLRNGGKEGYIDSYYEVETQGTDVFGVYQGESFDFTPGSYTTIDGVSQTGNAHNYGYLTLKKVMADDGPINYPPLSVRAWDFFKNNYSEDFFSTISGVDNSYPDPFTLSVLAINSLLTLLPVMAGFRGYAYSKGYSKIIDLEQSVIKLGSPDGKKYGGGHRVRRIEIKDDWLTEGSNDVIGVDYRYEVDFEQQEVLLESSGVASYEPTHLSEENALKYPLFYQNSGAMNVDANGFFEAPSNDALFPAPIVGYARVETKSINTSEVIAGNRLGALGTGVTVHKFYTSKDFPTIVDETPLTIQQDKVTIPIPTIGINVEYTFSASQGYVIINNDMHGREASVELYKLNADGSINALPTEETTYTYKTRDLVYQGANVLELDNTINVAVWDPHHIGIDKCPNQTGSTLDICTEPMQFGVDVDVMPDFRHFSCTASSGGVNVSVAVPTNPPPPTPPILPSGWPNESYTSSNSYLSVINKIVNKSGILSSVTTRKENYSLNTSNILHDGFSGAVILTKTTDNFNTPEYNYKIPAPWYYENTGLASVNTDLEFVSNISWIDSDREFFTISLANLKRSFDKQTNWTNLSTFFRLLSEGDEFLFYTLGTQNRYKGVATITSLNAAQLYSECILGSGSQPSNRGNAPALIFHLDLLFDESSKIVPPPPPTPPNTTPLPNPMAVNDLLGQMIQFKLTRSGRRNLLGSTVGNITSMENPTINRTLSTSPLGITQDMIGNELVDFLNTEVVVDVTIPNTNPNADGGVLKVGKYFLSDDKYFDAQNSCAHSYPTLFALFEAIEIYADSPIGGNTNTNPNEPLFGRACPEDYYMKLTPNSFVRKSLFDRNIDFDQLGECCVYLGPKSKCTCGDGMTLIDLPQGGGFLEGHASPSSVTINPLSFSGNGLKIGSYRVLSWDFQPECDMQNSSTIWSKIGDPPVGLSQIENDWAPNLFYPNQGAYGFSFNTPIFSSGINYDFSIQLITNQIPYILDVYAVTTNSILNPPLNYTKIYSHVDYDLLQQYMQFPGNPINVVTTHIPTSPVEFSHVFSENTKVVFVVRNFSVFPGDVLKVIANDGANKSRIDADGTWSSNASHVTEYFLEPNLSAFSYTNGTGQISVDYLDNSEDRDVGYCSFTGNKVTYNLKKVLQASAAWLSDNWAEVPIGPCGQPMISQISYNSPNPYASGEKGIWRPTHDYYYRDDRYVNSVALQTRQSTPSIKEGGVFQGNPNSANGSWDLAYYLHNYGPSTFAPLHPRWVYNNVITKYSSSGKAEESKDILGVYSASGFDFNDNQVVYVVTNAKRDEVIYDGFDNTDFWADNFPKGEATNFQVFSGAQSLRIKAGTLSERQIILPVSIEAGKSYHISYWLGGYHGIYPSQVQDATCFAPTQQFKLECLDVNSSPLLFTAQGVQGSFLELILSPSSIYYAGIKGSYKWRRVDQSFNIPVGTESIRLTVPDVSTSAITGPCGPNPQQIFDEVLGEYYVFIDDFRFHPEKALMKTWTYDTHIVKDYRMLSESDENNVPIHYGYTPSGELQSIQRLTDKGLRTIKVMQSNKKR